MYFGRPMRNTGIQKETFKFIYRDKEIWLIEVRKEEPPENITRRKFWELGHFFDVDTPVSRIRTLPAHLCFARTNENLLVRGPVHNSNNNNELPAYTCRKYFATPFQQQQQQQRIRIAFTCSVGADLGRAAEKPLVADR